MPLARLTPALAALVLPAMFVLAQTDRVVEPRANAWTTMVETAFADLNDEAKYADACERLERAGPRVVEFARQRLTIEARASASARQLRGLLYVLAKRGKEALPAVPELRTMLRELSDIERNPLVDQALCWALLALMPFVDDPTAATIERESGALIFRTGDEGALLRDMAAIGDDPGEERLLQRATSERFHHAACRWLVARAEDLPYDRARCTAALDACRQTIEVRLNSGSRGSMAAEVTDAWLAVGRAPLDARAALALLRHWDPGRRTRAVAWLRERGSTLSAPERALLAAAAWDPDSSVRSSAATTLAAWGQPGIVGLAALRHLQACHPDAAYRAHCAASADKVLAAFDDEPPADRALFTAVDLCLQGRIAEAPAVGPASATAMARVGEMLHLSAWSRADRIDAALRRIEAAGELDTEATKAVIAFLSLGDLEVRGTAWSWLARHPDAARDALAARVVTTSAALLEDLVSGVNPELRGEAIEAMAWIECGRATASDLRHFCTAGTSRHAVRGLAEALAREPGEVVVGPAPLRRLLAGEIEPEIKIVKDVMTMRVREFVVAADLRPHVRVLAALQTAAQGLPLPTDDATLDELLTTWCGATTADLPATLARWRRDGELGKRLDAIEADARKLLGVRQHLSWPRLAKP